MAVKLLQINQETRWTSLEIQLVRVMTFNIRFENDRDGVNSWCFRRNLVTDLIAAYSPWVLGTQEGVPNQLDYLAEQLPGYVMHAVGRPREDDTCQYPTLFYSRRHVELLQGGEFWLSNTPQIHRSKDWDSAFPRMLSYALFREKQAGTDVWVAVTHLDHIGEQARIRQAEIIRDWLHTRQGAKILLGDFNDLPGSPAHRLLTHPHTDLRDSWQILGRCEDHQSMTHHDFRGCPNKGRLDWVLVSPQFRVKAAGIVRDQQNERFPSDHFPYWADLGWE